MPTSLIDTAAAAKRKGCSQNAIVAAIKRNDIDGEQIGRYYAVKANRKFEDWQPQAVRQKAGKARAKKAKKKRKAS